MFRIFPDAPPPAPAKAIEMHLAAMRADGDEIPEPSRLEVVEIG